MAETGILAWRFATVPVMTAVVDASSQRGYRTYDVIYQAVRSENPPHDVAPLRQAIDRLVRAQNAIGDFHGTDRALFDSFVTAARRIAMHPVGAGPQRELERLGQALIARYVAKTRVYVGYGNALRARLLDFELVAAAVTLAFLVVLYFVVLRPSETYASRALEEIEERRERFTAIFDSGSEMMAIYDREGRLARGNRAAAELLGFTKEDVGKHFDIHVVPSDRGLVAQYFAHALAGNTTEFEATFCDARGREIPVLGNFAPIVVRGTVVGVAGSARDVGRMRQSERELLHSRERFRSIFEQNPNAVVGIAPDGTITDVNVELERLAGYSTEELVGRPAAMLVPVRRRERLASRIAAVVAGEAISYEGLLLCRDERELTVTVDMLPTRIADRTEGVFAVIKDVTHERALEQRVHEQQERLRALYLVGTSASGDAALQVDEALALGAGACRMPYGFLVQIVDGTLTVRHRVGPSDTFPIGFSMPQTHAIGERLLGAVHATGVEDLTASPWGEEIAQRGLPWKSYIGTAVDVDGEPYGVLAFIGTDARTTPFVQADYEFIDLMGTMVAAALSRERRQQELQKKAFVDRLTGAANRALLDDHMERVFARARRSHERIALYYMDLDGFKPINDRYGHAAGDDVLCEVTRRLTRAVREYDVVARIGGDEFVVLQPVCGERSSVEAMGQRLRGALNEPIALSDGTVVRVSVSLGIATFPADATNPTDLLARADAAMYREKEASRGARGAAAFTASKEPL